jgi:hypothetical protein
MRCEREFEDLVGWEAELVLFCGKVRAHAHAESAVGRLGRSAIDWADGVWRGRRVGVVRVINGKWLDVRSRGEERLIPSGVRDGGGKRVCGNDLRHGKGEEATLWREEHYE